MTKKMPAWQIKLLGLTNVGLCLDHGLAYVSLTSTAFVRRSPSNMHTYFKGKCQHAYLSHTATSTQAEPTSAYLFSYRQAKYSLFSV